MRTLLIQQFLHSPIIVNLWNGISWVNIKIWLIKWQKSRRRIKMRLRETGYYEDLDKGDVIVRKRPHVFYAEYISKNNLIWQKAEPDGNYMRELYFGQGNNCLSLISLEEAKKRLAEWGMELADKGVIIDGNEYRRIANLISMGRKLSGVLPQEEGYDFCKMALDLCIKWIQMEDIDLGDLYDCLDSPEEIDFTYYEHTTEDDKQKKIYRSLFNIIAYNTKKISKAEAVECPQYLDYIGEGYYDELLAELENEYPEIM